MADTWLHFVGVAGSGMSALAQYHATSGGRATGSDRAFDRGQHPLIRARLEEAGIEIVPQDGSILPADASGTSSDTDFQSTKIPTGIQGMESRALSGNERSFPKGGIPDAVIASTAIEADIPDLVAANERNVPIRHRSELLADYVAQSRSIAISGTSGKSTATAMLFELLYHCGKSPSVLTGGDLRLLQSQGHIGNAFVGESDLLVIEADESDGSLVRYEPWCGVLLNLQRDHKEPEELAAMFEVFRTRTKGPFLVGDDRNLDDFGAAPARRFGTSDRAEVQAVDLELGADSSTFRLSIDRDRNTFRLPVPGWHNVFNATAALSVGLELGLSPAEMSDALARFQGVARRFEIVGTPQGIDVIDDFGHNPKKIEATLHTAKNRAGNGKIFAIFQPHGFRPTAFIREELVDILAAELRPQDHFWFLDIFYAGGTAERTIHSRDLVSDLVNRGAPVSYGASREEVAREVTRQAKAGDQIIVLGARDPSLTAFATKIVQEIED